MHRFQFRQVPWFKWGVDFVGRYDRRDEDWRKLCTIAEVPHRPLKRKGIRISDGTRRLGDYYDDELRDRVAEFYAGEIEQFGFEFEENQK
jgi:hypothetical protein